MLTILAAGYKRIWSTISGFLYREKEQFPYEEMETSNSTNQTASM